MNLRQETYIYPAERRKGILHTYGSSYPLFREETVPQDFAGLLTGFEDITLLPDKGLDLPPGTGESRLLLPLVGGVGLSYGQENRFLSPGEWFRSGLSLHVHNPFGKPVNLLLLRFAVPARGFTPGLIRESFALDSSLTPFALSAPFDISVGAFGERQTTEKKLRAPGLLAYVIEGIFEVQDRLLNSRDALSLPGITSFDFECFTPGGIILFICNPFRPDDGSAVPAEEIER